MFLEKKLDSLKKIKLIIWDLDDTFWKGTLSEGEVELIDSNLRLIRILSQRGIINSICSKNDENMVLEKLKNCGMDEYFVFPSINWDNKGNRVKSIIADMSLREENVLFIDDNIFNLKEVEFANPRIMTASPEILPYIEEHIMQLGKDDKELSRLKQYKVLESKHKEMTKFASNVDFLRESNIKISIQKDCMHEKKRICELIMRTNQLNFTKNRISEDELVRILEDPNYESGCVRVSDKYGEYGIVGFYCLDRTKHKLEHFLFSCRTMGMGIEQYVYAMLNFPELDIVEPVSGRVSKLEGQCQYIELVDYDEEQNVGEMKGLSKVLLKGPCDLEVLASYLQKNEALDCEFNFVDSNGQQIDYFNHTVTILNTINLPQEEKERLAKKYSFLSLEAYETRLFSGEYDIIGLSILMDATLAVYRHKEKDYYISYGLYSKPITDSSNWDAYMAKEIMTARCDFSREQLKEFSQEFELVDYTPQMFCTNLKMIINRILEKKKDTKIILLLLPELPFTLNMKSNSNMIGKEKIHQSMNKAIKKEFPSNKNIKLLDVNHMITRQDDYFDNINHYSKLVYYKMAEEFTGLIGEYDEIKIEAGAKRQAVYDNIIRMLVKLKFRILRK